MFFINTQKGHHIESDDATQRRKTNRKLEGEEKKKLKSIQKPSKCREFITLKVIFRLRCLHATLETHCVVFQEKDRHRKAVKLIVMTLTL